MKTKQFKVRALRLALTSALAVGVGTFGVNCYAGTATNNLAVTAEIAANCTISTTAVAFSAYDPIGANASTPRDVSNGKVTTTCTNGSAVTVTLGQGASPDTGSTDAAPLRRMTDGTNFLSYNLYSDSSGGTVWGNTGGTGKGDTGTGAASDLTVYGRVPAGQQKPVGNYTDTVVATVTF